MPVYCVCYDLDEIGEQDYEGLIGKLKSLPAYCHAQLSVWFVATDATPSQLLAWLKPHLDKPDKLMILPIERGWTMNRKVLPVEGESSKPGTVGDWLRRWLV